MRKTGFTLIEMAIVLVIIGLVLGTVMGALSALRSSAALTTTASREATIKTALSSFVAQNYRLPCPANPALTSGQAGYGMEAYTLAAGTNAIVCSVNPVSTTYVGGLPWGSLGLTDEMGTDGYGNRYTYAVSKLATTTVLTPPAINPTAPLVSGMQGSINIYPTATPALANQSNSCPTVPGSTNPCSAVAVVVSHGQNGYYAYSRFGQLIAGPATPGNDELQNGKLAAGSPQDVNYVVKDFSSNAANPYDDMVLPITANDLLAPLVSSGALQNYNAQLQRSFSYMTNAVVSYALANHSAVLHSFPIPPATYAFQTVGQTIANDPWGGAITYIPNTSSSFTTNGITSGVAANTSAFSLVSAGPDGILQTAFDTSGNPTPVVGSDDVYVQVVVGQINSAFNVAGY
jgi:prepilin-type N-terminal cleavage/methylation domain-containing protein